MTAAVGLAPSRAGRLVRGLADLAVGGLLCTTPVTAVVALGWIGRWVAAAHDGQGRPGWVLGPRGAGAIVRLLGGLGSSIAMGVRILAGMAVWTLPFTALWLGAWWAGWENSFNKGYEQATVGPSVFLLGTLLSLPILTLLPYAVAHAAAEGRLAAFFSLARILRLARGAGWRGLLLALMSVAAAVPMFGLTVLPVFIEQLVPGFASLALPEQAAYGDLFRLAGAAWAFAASWVLRHQAARLVACDRAPGWFSWIWLVLSGTVWFGLVAMQAMGQFLTYAGHRWITHPLYLLPWPG